MVAWNIVFAKGIFDNEVQVGGGFGELFLYLKVYLRALGLSYACNSTDLMKILEHNTSV